VRPPLHKIAGLQLRTLLEQGWDENPENHPTFSAICVAIQSHVSQQQQQQQQSGSIQCSRLPESSESSGHLLRRESSGNTELMMRSNHGSSMQQQRSFRVLGLKRNADKTLSAEAARLISILQAQEAALSARVCFRFEWPISFDSTIGQC
jgi:hypothetical protein